mgnify:CR=1 FL=1
MAHAGYEQLTLGLFDTASPFSLSLGGSAPGTAVPEAAPAPELPPAPVPVTWRLAGDRALAKGWRGRAADNLAAIRLLQRIEQEDRPATAAEQAILGRFVGFGAGELGSHLFRRPGEAFCPGWAELGRELEQPVTPTELAALARSTQYAHYTPEPVIRAIWAALLQLGFTGGGVLEPGCGTGLFLALVPEAIAGTTRFTGIEAEPISARIARLLFPDARIRQEDFTQAALPAGFELALGNPPYSDRTVRGHDSAGRLGLALHDWCIARSLELLRPGGLAAFVTSRWTLDRSDATARQHLAGMADLLAAVRLPAGALRAAAGTDVVVDLLFLRKRLPGEASCGPAWLDLAEAVPAEDGESALRVNAYFLAHPAMVLGRHARTTGPFGPTYTCQPVPGIELATALPEALAVLPRSIALPPAEPVADAVLPDVEVGTAATGAAVKEGSYLVAPAGQLLQIVDGTAQPVTIRSGRGGEGIPARHAQIIKSLLPIRDAVRQILQAQAADRPWGLAQRRLRTAYAGFVRRFGSINRTSSSSRHACQLLPQHATRCNDAAAAAAEQPARADEQADRADAAGRDQRAERPRREDEAHADAGGQRHPGRAQAAVGFEQAGHRGQVGREEHAHQQQLDGLQGRRLLFERGEGIHVSTRSRRTLHAWRSACGSYKHFGQCSNTVPSSAWFRSRGCVGFQPPPHSALGAILARLAWICSGVRSCTCVATDQWWPNGSRSWP